MRSPVETRLHHRFRSNGVAGSLVYVLGHARARALRDGVAFLTGPDGEAISIAYVNDAWVVSPASFFTPEWADKVLPILEQHGSEEDPFA